MSGSGRVFGRLARRRCRVSGVWNLVGAADPFDLLGILDEVALLRDLTHLDHADHRVLADQYPVLVIGRRVDRTGSERLQALRIEVDADLALRHRSLRSSEATVHSAGFYPFEPELATSTREC